MKLKSDFEYFLQTKFDEMGTYGETPITKDNCENLYEIWSEKLDVQELIDYADEFAVKLAEDIIKEAQSLHKSGSHSNSIDIDSYLKTQFLK